MKKIMFVITLSLMFATGAIPALAAGKERKSDTMAIEQTGVVDNAALNESEEYAGEPVVKGSKSADGASSGERNADSGSWLSIIVCCVAVLALLSLLAALYAILLGRNALRQIEEMPKRSQKAEDHYDRSQYLTATQVKQFVDESVKDLRHKVEEFEARKNEPEQHPAVEAAEVVQKPVFMSQIYYGVCMPRYCGVMRNQLSLQREPSHVVKIETVSETEAKFSLVEGLSNTQFAALADFAVEIVEGNQREYSSISQLEEGVMQLDDDAWVIKHKIKVKLS